MRAYNVKHVKFRLNFEILFTYFLGNVRDAVGHSITLGVHQFRLFALSLPLCVTFVAFLRNYQNKQIEKLRKSQYIRDCCAGDGFDSMIIMNETNIYDDILAPIK